MNDLYYKNTEWLPSLKNENNEISKILSSKKFKESHLSSLKFLLKSKIHYTNQIRIISDYLNKIHKVGYFHQDLHSGNVMYKLGDPYNLKINDCKYLDSKRAKKIPFIK